MKMAVATFKNKTKLPMLVTWTKTVKVLNPEAKVVTLDLKEIECFQLLGGRGLEMTFFSCCR